MQATRLAEATERLGHRVGRKSTLGATLKFDFGKDGCIHLDARSDQNRLTNDSRAADCVVRMSLDLFESIMAGKIDAMTAFMTGKLKVEGNISIAMRLPGMLV